MLERFSLSRFRRFSTFEIEGLKRVNLITGPNGAGKTSLLEALFIYCGAFSPELAFRVNLFRGMQALHIDFSQETATVMRSIFHDLKWEHEAVLRGREADGLEVSVKISVPESASLKTGASGAAWETTGQVPTPAVKALQFRTTVGESKPFISTLSITAEGTDVDRVRSARQNTVFLQPRTESLTKDLVSRFGKVVVAKEQERLIGALSLIEPRLTSIASVLEGDQTVLYADIGKDELVPLWLLGGGINHLAHIVLAILEERKRVVLIDEVENGVYYGILPGMWRVIDHAAREADCQVFATTHSRECVAAAYDVFSETFDYELGFFRLEPRNGAVKAVSYDKETLAASLEAGFEVR
ncbi:MAG: AAA family ATPase [Thermoleophilia bacterium]